MSDAEKPWWQLDFEEEWQYAATRKAAAQEEDAQDASDEEDQETGPETSTGREPEQAGASLKELRARVRRVHRTERRLADARADVYAQAAQLSDDEGWSVTQIADAMKVTRKTAHGWIKAGRVGR